MEGKISVITVCFNAGEMIRETIESVIKQSYSNIEYIIIDGGSTDDTMSIINNYKDSISKIISEKDNGVFDAMNKGILYSTGSWVNFLNAGDSYLTSDLLSLINFKKNNDKAIIYGNRVVDMKKLTFPFPEKSILFGMIPACHQAMFFNKRLLGEEFKHDLKYSLFCEYEMVARLYKNKFAFFYQDINMVNYLSGGISSEVSTESRKAKYYFLFKYFGFKGLFYGIGEKMGFLKLPKPLKESTKYKI